MPVAVVAVHQLRYWLAYGPDATHELAEQGHSYLTSAIPWTVMLAAVSTGAFLARLAVTRYPLASAGHPSVRVWGWASVSLLAIYALQEFLEGLFAGGHPEGPLGIFGGGGWWAIPAAVAVAGVLALLLRGAHVLVNAVARRRRSVRRARPRRVGAPVPPVVEPVHVAPLARCAAGRAPPVAASAAL